MKKDEVLKLFEKVADDQEIKVMIEEGPRSDIEGNPIDRDRKITIVIFEKILSKGLIMEPMA